MKVSYRRQMAGCLLTGYFAACASHAPLARAEPEPWPLKSVAGDVRRIEVRGNQLRFLDTGNSEGEVPWLLVHGIDGRIEDFSFLPIDAARAGRRVIAVDLPGFGMSTTSDRNFEIGTFVRVLRDFLDQVNVPRVHLGCHSLGGQICVLFSLEHWSRVASLTLIDAAGTYDTRTYSKNMLKNRIGMNLGRMEGAHNPLLEFLGGGDQSAVKRLLMNDATPLAAVASFRGNLRAQLRRLRVPTLIIWSIDDPIFPVEEATYLAENISGSELHLIEQGTHVPFEAHHEQIFRWMQHFIDSKN